MKMITDLCSLVPFKGPTMQWLMQPLSTLKKATLVLATGITVVCTSADVVAKNARYNSINEMPRNLVMADIDGDSKMEILQFSKNRVFGYEADFDHSGKFHYYSRYEFKQMIVGAFREQGHSQGRDDICFIRTDNMLDCYTVSPDGKTLWWWFRQGSFIGNGDQVVVGDYNNDGTEDIALYKPSNGQLSFHAIKSTGYFFENMAIQPGNLSGRITANGRIYAGHFSGDTGSDLVFINVHGQVQYFRSVTSSGARTFWWGFTTHPMFSTNDEILIANVEGESTDNIVKRAGNTGAYHFYKARYSNGWLQSVSGISQGQLPVVPANSSVGYFGKLAGFESEPGHLRDDMLLYDKSNVTVKKVDARYSWSSSSKTYWWHYTRGAGNLYSHWPTRKSYKVAIVKCIETGKTSADVRSHSYIRNFFDRNKTESVNDYFMDISMGQIDLEKVDVYGNYSVDYSDSPSRTQKIDRCVSKIGFTANNYDKVIAHTSNSEYGAVGNSKLLLSKNSFVVSTGAHEILHIFGLGHSYGETQKSLPGCSWCGPSVYQNKYDIMSANNIFTFATSDFGSAGPLLMPYFQKEKLFTVPYYKTYKRTNTGSFSTTRTIKLTSSSRPESPNYLYGDFVTHKGVRFTVEYRTKESWDRAIQYEGIVINRIDSNGKPFAIWNAADTEVLVLQQAGDSWQDNGKGIRVKLTSINNAKGIATVEVRY